MNPASPALASQSLFCFASSIVSGLVAANSLPLRYTALGCFPNLSVLKLATRRSWADFARVRKYPLGQIQLRSGLNGAMIQVKLIRRRKGDSLNSSVSVIAPGSTARTDMFVKSLLAERRRWSSYLSWLLALMLLGVFRKECLHPKDHECLAHPVSSHARVVLITLLVTLFGFG